MKLSANGIEINDVIEGKGPVVTMRHRVLRRFLDKATRRTSL